MARIYIARTTGIGSFERHVVLKMILPERASDKNSVDMFLDEARLAAALNHQNVAQVFEVGQESGVHYLAMEYVHGQDLRAVLSKAGHTGARIPIELSLAIVAGAAAGLHHAHDRKSPDGVPLGIVHRDVSPSNIMIGYDGAVKLLDFGIAKATARSHETQSGIIKGKFAYMSPEQCRGREVDRRSDVFSLGIILYEITTQHRCFRADSDFDTMHRIVTGDVVRPSRLVATYPAELEKIVMMALAVDPSRRYASAAALLEELEAFASYSRLAPSAMALGRFMRELFGEVQEPWLTEHRSAAGVPRESTVSNTMDSQARFGSSRRPEPDEPSQQIHLGDAVLDWSHPEGGAGAPDTWPPKEPSRSGNTWAAKPSSRARSGLPAGSTPSSMNAAVPSSAPSLGAKAGAGQTLLDLPRGGQEAEDALDWDAKAYPQAQPTFASQLEVPSERKASTHGHEPSTVAPAPRSASGSGALRSTGPRRAFPAPSPQPQPLSNSIPQPLSTSQSMSSLASAASAAPGARSATSQPLSMPQLAPLSSDGKTSTASALAALPLGTASFSTLEGSAEKKLRAESLSELRPQRRLLVGVMVMILVVAFAALLVIALGGDGVDTIAPRPEPTQSAPPNASGSGSAAGSATGVEAGSASGSGSGSAVAPEAGNGSAGGTSGSASEPAGGAAAPTSGAGTAGTSAGGASSAGSPDRKLPDGQGGAATPATDANDRTVPPSVTMHLQVTSDPKGADVYLNNKRLGVTPLSVFLPKRTGSATLSVRRQRFVEASAKIDLSSGEVSKSFSLRRAPDRPRERTGDDEGKPAKECQRPESANPFDDTPICE
jgi:serine/threonine protein kinase